jgi:hypothetical protein
MAQASGQPSNLKLLLIGNSSVGKLARNLEAGHQLRD